MSKYDAEDFDPLPGADLKCSICHGIFDNPRETPCGHVFCLNCITCWMGNRRNCPSCRRRFRSRDLKPAGLALSLALAALRRKCPNSANGCATTNSVQEHSTHVSTCPYEMVVCPHRRCDQNVLRRDLQAHRDLCDLRPVVCQARCRLGVPFCEISTHDCFDYMFTKFADQETTIDLLLKRIEKLESNAEQFVKQQQESSGGGGIVLQSGQRARATGRSGHRRNNESDDDSFYNWSTDESSSDEFSVTDSMTNLFSNGTAPASSNPGNDQLGDRGSDDDNDDDDDDNNNDEEEADNDDIEEEEERANYEGEETNVPAVNNHDYALYIPGYNVENQPRDFSSFNGGTGEDCIQEEVVLDDFLVDATEQTVLQEEVVDCGEENSVGEIACYEVVDMSESLSAGELGAECSDSVVLQFDGDGNDYCVASTSENDEEFVSKTDDGEELVENVIDSMAGTDQNFDGITSSPLAVIEEGSHVQESVYCENSTAMVDHSQYVHDSENTVLSQDVSDDNTAILDEVELDFIKRCKKLKRAHNSRELSLDGDEPVTKKIELEKTAPQKASIIVSRVDNVETFVPKIEERSSFNTGQPLLYNFGNRRIWAANSGDEGTDDSSNDKTWLMPRDYEEELEENNYFSTAYLSDEIYTTPEHAGSNTDDDEVILPHATL